VTEDHWTDRTASIQITPVTDPPYALRLATLDDVGQVEDLIRRSMWTLGVRDYSPAQVTSVLKYAMGVDTQLIRDGTYFVVIDPTNSRIVGAGGWSFRTMLHGGDGAKQPGDEAPLDPARGDAARIRAFFVDPAHARRGIGRMLVELCESKAREAGFTRMELAATLTGVNLYAACGFEVIERVESTLPDGTRAALVRMGKPLGSGRS
jgi:GNAT superfamily N-acetyltransferase